MLTPANMSSRSQRTEGEPTMLLQAPISARSQDVRHVLTRTFKDLFTKDTVSPETIKNLLTSKGSDDEYHEKYVDRLKEAYEQREKRLSDINLLEKHIMQAQAKAISAEERHLNHSDLSSLRELGMPVGQNHFRACVDSSLLKAHKLLTPDMYSSSEAPVTHAPVEPAERSYMKDTSTFQQSIRGQKEKKLWLAQSQLVKDSSPNIFSREDRVVHGDKSPDFEVTLAESVEDVNMETHVGVNLSKVQTGDGAKRAPAWKQQMNAERRENEKQLLQRLQERADYLKNPRFNPEGPKLLTVSLKKTKAALGLGESTKVFPPAPHAFVPYPPVVTFSEYSTSQVYEATLELKNVSMSLQPVRVIPPSTGYFAVGLGQFPGEQGLVAAGMAVKYKIRFMPDSLGEYEDEICVHSQGGQPLRIKMVARRLPPVITLPPVIDVGHSLVGGARVAKYTVRNDGGPGKFCMMPKTKWPAVNFKSVVNPSALVLAPFQIQPAVFELHHGESCILTVTFCPPLAEMYQQTMLVVCDNCQVKEFTFKGEGQFATVEFLAVDGGVAEQEPGELCDMSAQKLIRFDDLNPYTFSQKNLLINNVTQVDLPFEWKFVKPLTELRESDDNDSAAVATARTLDYSSSFNVDPQAGVLPAGSVSKFVLTFAPAEIDAHHGVLHLVLLDIPSKPLTNHPNNGASNGGEHNSSANGKNDNSLALVTSLEIECKARCVPLKVLLKPYALYLNGAFLIGTTTRKHFNIVNNSLSPVVFRWDCTSTDHILEVIPPFGEVGAGGVGELEVTVTGCKVGEAHEVLYCYVKHLEDPLALPVHFEVKGPEVVFDEADLSFGLVRFSQSAKSVLHVRNTSEMLIQWAISEKLPANHTASDRPTEFTFTPSEGELKPLEAKPVTIHFFPQSCQSVQTFFMVDVNNGESNSCIAVMAEVQNPDVCFLSCKLDIPKVFLNMPMSQYITVVNKTYLKTEYTFGKPFGSGAKLCKIDICEKGEIGPRDQIELELTFTALQQVDRVSNVMLPCYILGMDDPLVLSITACVESLSVTCCVFDSIKTKHSTLRSSSEGLAYGVVDLGQPATKFLSIRNNTAIPTSYHICVDCFEALPPLPLNPGTQKQLEVSKGSATRPLLMKTPNIADPSSKTKAQAETELKQTMLRTGRGLAISLQPSSGSLSAYEETLVEVVVYSDMWGQYTDTLVCRVGDLHPIAIPITVDVIGVPLQFQMAANQSINKEVTLRFGTHASNSETVSRRVRINNISPFDIRLDWKFFSIQSGDKQLLDFIVTYGDPFPLLDDGTQSQTTANGAKLKPTVAHGPVVRTSTRSDEPLIQVVVSPHQGVVTDKPYSVSPRQMTVAARNMAFATFIFNPQLGEATGEECMAYALAYLSINEEAQQVPHKVKRGSGYQTLQLKLNVTGTIKPACLTVEYLDEEGLRYRSAASDLLAADGSGGTLKTIKKHSAAKVTNQTEALLKFKVQVPNPFCYEGSTNHMAAVTSNDWLELKPSQSTQLNASFCVKDSLLNLAETQEVRKYEDVGSDSAILCVCDGERQLYFSQKLKIMFSNGATQELPLLASLVVPSFATNRLNLDFGMCLVGQKKQLTFTLFNRTRSGTVWTAHVQPRTDSCSYETFCTAPSSGKLDAHVAHVTKSSVIVTVSFVANDAEDYEAALVIEGRLGEKPLTVNMKGSGSYDERHESLINLEINPESAN